MSNPDSSRRLVVVRHAKSSWPSGVPDRERPLGERGIRDAPVMGQRLASAVGRVDLALVSPARRTRETWELLSSQLPEVGQARTEPRIYQAWGGDLMALVTELPAEARSVLLLGHEPGVSSLVLALADAQGYPEEARASGTGQRDSADSDTAERESWELRDRIEEKFPTCAAALLEAELPWAEFARGCARLTGFLTPKG